MAHVLLITKSHVSAFTRKDGAFVAAHDDKRTKAAFSHSTDKWNSSHVRVKGDGHNSMFHAGSAAENLKSAKAHASNMSAVHAAGRAGEMDNAAKTLAKKHAGFSTLETANSDREDFTETSRQSMKGMLHEAYKAGGGKAGKGADKAVSDAAKHHLMMDDLSDTNSGEDFKEVSKHGVKNAVHHAFAAGHASANKKAASSSGNIGDSERAQYGDHFKEGDKVKDNYGNHHEVLSHIGAEVKTKGGQSFHPTKVHRVK